MMNLITALRCAQPTCLAFVGAGGKTTAIFRAAEELSAEGKNIRLTKTVLVTTTTHFGAWQASLADHYFVINSESDVDLLFARLLDGVLLLAGDVHDDRLKGLSPNILERVHRIAGDYELSLLIEADGARNLPLKAPAQHEPVIPDFVRTVIVTAGLQGLGKPLTNEWVHRPDQFAKISGLRPGTTITQAALIDVFLSTDGGLKNIPSQAGRIALLNQADTASLQSAANAMAGKLIPDYQSVITASLLPGGGKVAASDHQIPGTEVIYSVTEQIGAIILAAGGSSRFGAPKQLLRWKGTPLIRRVALNALQAGLRPVIVVLGAFADEIAPEIKDLDLRIVNNSEWMAGLSTSIKAGLEVIPINAGGAVFLQTDQPQIPILLIKSLVDAHRTSLAPIIAPLIDGQRGNPVLFDAQTFPALKAISGDVGGRTLFNRYPVEWLPWHDANLLIDIDSPEDYQRLLSAYPEDEAMR